MGLPAPPKNPLVLLIIYVVGITFLIWQTTKFLKKNPQISKWIRTVIYMILWFSLVFAIISVLGSFIPHRHKQMNVILLFLSIKNLLVFNRRIL